MSGAAHLDSHDLTIPRAGEPKLVDRIAGASSSTGSAQRLNIDPAEVRKGLGQLVLTIVKLLHEIMERQAVRRMEAGTLTDDEVERVGTTLMLQSEEIQRLCDEFGVRETDLNLDLGPVGRLL
jgi:hypothetical protein